MAFSHHSFFPTTTYAFLVILFYLALPTLSQKPGSGSIIPRCGTPLLPLAACAPFVQGKVQSPAQTCCNNIKLIYNQQADCLCRLLNESNLVPFPINRTLALKLPNLCHLQLNISTCSEAPLAPTSPASQIPLGTKTNSTVAASPTVMVTPRSSILGFHRNAGTNFKRRIHLGVVVVAVVSLSVLTEIIC